MNSGFTTCHPIFVVKEAISLFALFHEIAPPSFLKHITSRFHVIWVGRKIETEVSSHTKITIVTEYRKTFSSLAVSHLFLALAFQP